MGGGDGDAPTLDARGVARDAMACAGPLLDTLIDPFDGPTLRADLWTFGGDVGCDVETAADFLEFSGQGACGVRSVREDYCLRGGSISIELTDAGQENDPRLTLRLAGAVDDWLAIEAWYEAGVGSRLSGAIATGAATVPPPAPVSFAEGDRLVVSSHADGLLHVELHGGPSVTPLWTFEEPAWSSRVAVELKASRVLDGDDGGFDSLNVR